MARRLDAALRLSYVVGSNKTMLDAILSVFWLDMLCLSDSQALICNSSKKIYVGCYSLSTLAEYAMVVRHLPDTMKMLWLFRVSLNI